MSSQGKQTCSLTAGYVLLVLALIVVADWGGGPRLFPWVYHRPGLDKLGHLVLMGTLAYLVNRTVGTLWPAREPVWLSTASWVVLVLVTLEECSQIWLPYRTFEWSDLAADYVGIVVLGGLGSRWGTSWTLSHHHPSMAHPQAGNPD